MGFDNVNEAYGITVLHTARGLILLFGMAVGLSGACASHRTRVHEQDRIRMLSLLMPNRIEIVEPFTRVKSFDDDSTPDGIELLLQAVNSLDNPGLMIAGHVRIELHEYVAASAMPHGRRLARWEIDLATKRQQLTYWNQLTQMYEFRLAIDPKRVPPAEKYLLVVTYDSPLDERLTDEYVIRYRGSGEVGTAGGGIRPSGVD